MTGENDFEAATQFAVAALVAVKGLPHSPPRAAAIEDIRAAIGWIKQARDEWATEADQ